MPRELAFIDGALGGVNTMLNVVGVKEGIKDRQFNRERTLKLDDMAAEDRQYNRDRQERMDGYYEEDRDRQNYWTEVLNEQQARLSNLNLDDAEHRAARRPVTDAQSDALHNQNRILNDINIRNARGQEQQRVLTESYNLLRGFNSFVDGQEVDEPAIMNSLNYFLQGMINDSPGTANKKITGLTPAPDGSGVMVELGVEPKGGQAYNAPLTRNRSADPADPVVVVPYTDLFAMVNEVADDLQEAGFQGDMPQITRQLEEYLRVASGDRSVEEAAAELAKEEREHQRAIELENVKAENRPGNQTINTIEYFRNNMVNPDGSPITVEQAVEISNLAKSDPREAVIRVFQQLSDSQNSSLMPNQQDQRLSEDELMLKAQEMVGTLSDAVMPTRGVSTAPAGLRPPVRSTPAATSPAAAPAGNAAGGVVAELPPAAEYDGMVATDQETGARYQSINGEWVPIQ